MRLRTAVALVVLLGALAGAVVVGLGSPAAGGSLAEVWVSDTPRENRANHHAVGVGPDAEVVVAPVAEIPRDGVELTNSSCVLARLAPGDGAVRWRAGLPAANCTSHALTEPAIADLDGDGDLEVAAATTADALVVRGVSDGREEWRVDLSTFGYGRPTVGNLTPAPGPEVVASDIGGGVVAATGEGRELWRVDLETLPPEQPTVWERPVVRDLDGDGAPEVLLGTRGGPVVLGADGDLEWYAEGTAVHTATVRTDDDAVEVVTAGTDGLRAYDGATGDLEWERDLPGSRVRVAADVDGDGSAAVFVGRTDGTVLAVDAATGETRWTTTVATGDGTGAVPPVLGDVDGDGTDELVAATNDGTVAVLAPGDGAELAAYERSVPVWTFPTPADIDGDGDEEVLVRYGDGRVVALAYG
jgi:outer membrane protein assembly factor BamB